MSWVCTISMASPPVILCAAAIVMAYCHSVPWDILSYRIMSSSCLYIQILNIQYACMSWSWYLCAMLRVPVLYACIVCYEYTHMPRCLYRCIVYSVHCVCLYAIHRQRLIMSGESSVLLRCSCPSNIFFSPAKEKCDLLHMLWCRVQKYREVMMVIIGN